MFCKTVQQKGVIRMGGVVFMSYSCLVRRSEVVSSIAVPACASQVVENIDTGTVVRCDVSLCDATGWSCSSHKSHMSACNVAIAISACGIKIMGAENQES